MRQARGLRTQVSATNFWYRKHSSVLEALASLKGQLSRVKTCLRHCLLLPTIVCTIKALLVSDLHITFVCILYKYVVYTYTDSPSAISAAHVEAVISGHIPPINKFMALNLPHKPSLQLAYTTLALIWNWTTCLGLCKYT